MVVSMIRSEANTIPLTKGATTMPIATPHGQNRKCVRPYFEKGLI